MTQEANNPRCASMSTEGHQCEKEQRPKGRAHRGPHFSGKGTVERWNDLLTDSGVLYTVEGKWQAYGRHGY